MARENLDKIEFLVSRDVLLASFMGTEHPSLEALSLKINEFQTTGLEQIVDVINKTEMTAEEKLL